MEERMLKIYSVFLASSNELKEDRDQFAVLISRLNDHYNSRGYLIILKAWEFLDPAYHNKRKQDEYNDVIKQCDLFVALFHTKAEKYTVEELQIARHECETRQMPLFIYFRDLSYWQELKKKDKNLEAIKKYIGDDMQHFWGSYNTNDKLHLDFVLWLDSYLFDGKAPFKVENGHVMLDDVKVADMSGLPFAANNNEYQQLEERLKSLNEVIEQLKQDIQKYPDDLEFRERLNKKEIERNKVQEKFEVQQEALLGAARRIAEMRKQLVGKKLQEAINAFESGQLDKANNILDGLEKEGEIIIEDFETKREQIHEHIDALLFQTETVMADVNIPIENRIARVVEIYAKADDWANRSAYDKEKYAKLLYYYADFHYKCGVFDKGIQIYLRQIALIEELYGKDTPDTAIDYNNIGLFYGMNGEYDKALVYYSKALVICEKVLDKDHPFIAAFYNNIGGIYDCNGEYDKALEYYFKALKINEKVLGTKRTSTAKFYNNIGMAYYNLGDYDKAEEYCFKALVILEKVLGPGHPDTASSYNNIGLIYDEQDNFDKALEYYFKALGIDEKVLGPGHPNTANDYNNIGGVYDSKGEYDKALEYYLKALEIDEKVLGTEHPNTATSYNNIGLVYDKLGEYDKALEYYLKALEIDEKVLGKDHPSTAITYNNIAEVYYGKGDDDKAREYFRKAEESRKKGSA